ncbi:MAG: leucyl aminopeptidase, partial [Gammaproteobacteria bacterium]
MEFTIISGAPEKQRVPCVVAGVFDKRKLAETAAQLDQASHHYVSRIIKQGDLEGRLGQTLMLHQVPGTAAERILLIGCGPENELSDNKYREILVKAVASLNDSGVTEAASYLAEIPIPDRGVDWRVRQAVETAESALYRFDRLKSKREGFAPTLRSLRVAIASPRAAAIAEEALKDGLAIAEGVRAAKDLANLPSNHCTPAYLAEEARRMQKRYAAVKVEVLGIAQIKKLRMGAFLAVARGSREPPALIILKYRGARLAQAPVALVGKGITFDSGGISIKPAAAMDEMKYDMCGAASVLGTLRAVAELRLPINLVGLIPATENMPGGNAVKPGDIVTSLSGQTIEIL